MPAQEPEPQDAKTIRILRRGIGIVGLLLSPSVALGCIAFRHGLPGSMSATYYTEMRNVFVGGLWAIGVFLICYRPPRVEDSSAKSQRRRWWVGVDRSFTSANFWSSVAGLLAMLVALFPTLPDQSVVRSTDSDQRIATIHFISAIFLFVVLALFCLVSFPRSAPGQKETAGKRLRNWVYRGCGILIFVALIAAGVTAGVLSKDVYAWSNPLLWCEWAAVWAFAFAWFVKGETILTDSQVKNFAEKTSPPERAATELESLTNTEKAAP